MKQVVAFLFLVTCASCLKQSSARIEENTAQSFATKARAVTDPDPANIRIRGFDILSTITTADLDDVRSYKANVVRALFTNTSHRFINEKDANGNYSLNVNAFAKLDQLVALCRTRSLKLIIDPHTTPGAINPYTGNPGDRLWTDTKLQDMVVEMWRQISNHCHTGSSFIIYDLYNEPFLPTGKPNAWNELAKRIVVALRDGKQDKCEILLQPSGYQGNGWVDRIPNLPNLIIPKKANGSVYPNITVSPHLYTPLSYTHQVTISGYPPASYTTTVKNQMLNEIQIIRNYQINNNNVKINIGEFSVTRAAADGNSYLADAVNKFESYSWDWVYHSFREAYDWDAEMEPLGNVSQQPRNGNTDRMQFLKNKFQNNQFPVY
jgi:hypothetical protein